MNGLAHRGLRVEEIAHGRRARYVAGCRCELCRTANRNYARKRAKAQREGDWNGLVPADRARAHLLSLSRKGVGRRAVAAATDIADSVLHKIRQGTRRKIRARTERLILSVTAAAVSDRALVKPGRTAKLIELLQDEGYSKAELARKLGYAAPALQFKPHRMTARNVARVETLYRRLTT